MNAYLVALVLGIIEGITEFLPVSSTAHLRIAESLLGLNLGDSFWKMFTIVIQLGAVLCLPVYFRKRIARFVRTFPNGEHGERTVLTHPLTLTMVAFVVTAVPAFLLTKLISKNLENLTVIGSSLVIGGAIMWAVDALFGDGEKTIGVAQPAEVSISAAAARPQYITENPSPGLAGEMITTPSPELPGEAVTTPSPGTPGEGRGEGPLQSTNDPHPNPLPDHRGKGQTRHMEEMSLAQSIWIGFCQIFSAIFPGTSRSMATIAGGQLAGLNRSTALEFSFFLSMPTMFAATAYDLFKALRPGKGGSGLAPAHITGHEWVLVAIGFVVSFFVAWAVVAWFMKWVRTRGFVPFAVYRIAIGLGVLIWLARV